MKPIFTLVLLSGLASAQVYTPPTAPAANPNPAPPQDTTVTRPKQEPAKSPYGEEVPLLDPAAETITLNGVAIPLGDNRVLKARFEKYLSQPPEDSGAATEYRETIKRILDTISPLRRDGKKPDMVAAFRLLPAAGSYPGDSDISASLAEAIYVAMQAKNGIDGVKQLNDSLVQEKHQVESDNDWKARHDTDKTLGDGQTTGGTAGGKGGKGGGQAKQNQPAQNPGAGVVSLKYLDGVRRIAEIEALQKKNIAQSEITAIQTKAQYQVNMVQWFIQRRYEHVLMASRFYNQIWKDGDQTLRVGKDSDVSKLFSQSIGMSPTVASLDSLSNEAIRDVDKAIDAFDLMLSQNNLHSASQRLMEAYALGEFLTPVATLPLEKKQRIADYFRDLNELYGTLQAHDYTRAKELATRMKASAKDFPASKVDSAIAGYTLASDLAVEEAKMQLVAKNNDKAAEKIKSAAEIWPTNPKLAEFRSMIGQAGPMVTNRNDFDRLLSEGNYREIFKRQYELAPAIQGDATREEAFKTVITNLGKIEQAIGKAAEFSRMGQACAAYEQLAEIRQTFPDDPKLGHEIEALAPNVADFTRALDRAHQFEERSPKQTGSALTWYLKARSIFPASKFADEGIKRQLDEILPEDTASR